MKKPNISFNIGQFLAMTLKERIELITKYGEYIGHIRENLQYIDLYLVHNQYIEVKHNLNLFNINSIELISIKDERLELYAAKVNISQLFN